MQFIVKLVIANAVILTCSYLARRRPELAGLIAVMPLTGLIVMLWVYHDVGGNMDVLIRYTQGAIWGIIPSILFFAAVWCCFRQNWSLSWTLALSFGIWLIGAAMHQYLLIRR